MVLDGEEDKRLTIEYLHSLGLAIKDTWHDSVWAGIDCLGTRRSFHLSKNGDTVTFVNWVPSQPDNAIPEEDCVAFAHVFGVYGYHDIECKLEFPVVCQKDLADKYFCQKQELFSEALM